MYTSHNDPRFPEQRRLHAETGEWITPEQLLQLFLKGGWGNRIAIEKEVHLLFDMFDRRDDGQ